MRWLRSFLYNGVFLIGTAAALLVVSPLLLTTTAHALGFVRWWARVQSIMLRVLVGLDYEVRGQEHIDQGGAIYACKHQSAWDTFVFFLIFNDPAYVLKKELLSIPIWGQFARKCRAIAVDRDGGASALKALVRDTKDRLAAGRAVVIFPEGTRTQPGRRRAYHPGVAALYKQCGVPVIPVALNSGLFWGRRSYLKQPGTITVEFLEAIPAGLPRPEFMAALEDAMENTSDRLAREAVGRFPHVAGELIEDDRQSPPADPLPGTPEAVGEPVDKSAR